VNFILSIFLILGLSITSLPAAERPKITPDQALSKLVLGNRRYVTNHMLHPHQSWKTRLSLSKGQHPFATVLSCADSRVPPEIVFDEGLGDLFVVRVAGNILDDMILGSMEYAAEHLHVPLIVVLGHTGCGAVTAAVSGTAEHNHLDLLMKALQPAVVQASKEPGDPVANAIRDNIQLVVKQIRDSQPVMAELQAKGQLKVLGALYHLDTGHVEFLK
jgi:carbonic anhydrase